LPPFSALTQLLAMPPIRLLHVAFANQFDVWKLPALRGAIVEKVGHEHDLFHNHDNERGGYHYRYPLIQYKLDRTQPMLVCLNEGVEALHHYFSQPDWTLNVHGQQLPMRIARLDVRQHPLIVRDAPQRYHLRHWLPLNSENFRTYSALPNLLERVALLEQILRSQLVAFAREMNGALPEQEITARIREIKSESWASFKGVKVRALSLEFATNLYLPGFVGLGKGCSMGWGMLKGLGNGPG
jgi:hypothetical protein